jgi:hypothetical protein
MGGRRGFRLMAEPFPYVIQQSAAGFAPRGQYHLARDKRGPALCRARPSMSPVWNVWGNRVEFEARVPHRICAHCRKLEALR